MCIEIFLVPFHSCIVFYFYVDVISFFLLVFLLRTFGGVYNLLLLPTITVYPSLSMFSLWSTTVPLPRGNMTTPLIYTAASGVSFIHLTIINWASSV